MKSIKKIISAFIVAGFAVSALSIPTFATDGEGVIGGVVNGVEDAAEGVIEGAEDIVGGVADGAEEIIDGAGNTVEDVVDGDLVDEVPSVDLTESEVRENTARTTNPANPGTGVGLEGVGAAMFAAITAVAAATSKKRR